MASGTSHSVMQASGSDRTARVIPAFIIILALFFHPETAAQTLIDEHFDHPMRDSLEGLGGWYRSGINSEHNIRIVSAGLQFSGAGRGGSALMTNEANGDLCLLDLPSVSAGTLYLSFLMSVDSITEMAAHGYNISLDEAGDATNHTAAVYVQRLTADTFRLGVRKLNGTTAYVESPFDVRATYLVVAGYAFAPGANDDSVKLFVFRDEVPAIQPEHADAGTDVGDDVPAIGQVVMSNAYDQTGLQGTVVRIDEIVVSQDWRTVATSSARTIEGTAMPSGFQLLGNYPNPFNPSTTIRFSVPSSGHVSLSIYDLLGRQVAILADELLPAGEHVVRWDATGMPSGVYVARLWSGDVVLSRTMILCK